MCDFDYKNNYNDTNNNNNDQMTSLVGMECSLFSTWTG